MSLRDKMAFAIDLSIIAALGVVYVAGLTVQTLLTHMVHPIRGTGLLPYPDQKRQLSQG